MFSPHQTSLNPALEGENDQSLTFRKTSSFWLQNMTKVWKSIYRLRRAHKNDLQVTRVPSSTFFCRMKIREKTTFFCLRQQKSIFGQLFKQIFIDQTSTWKVCKHVTSSFYVFLGSLRVLYDLCVLPALKSRLRTDFEKMAQIAPNCEIYH